MHNGGRRGRRTTGLKVGPPADFRTPPLAGNRDDAKHRNHRTRLDPPRWTAMFQIAVAPDGQRRKRWRLPPAKILVQAISIARPPSKSEQARCNMTRLAIPPQALFEHEMLASISSELRTAVFSRNVACLHTITLAFQDHLNRMLALEEEGGFLATMLASHPEHRDDVELLVREHHCFRMAVERILAHWPSSLATDDPATLKTSRDLLSLLEMLDEHNAREVDLLSRAMVGNEPSSSPQRRDGDESGPPR